MPQLWVGLSALWAVALAYSDCRHRRLPNVATLGGGLIGLLALAVTGTSPLGASGMSMLAGSGLALLLTLPGYFLRQLGAGDVKLLLAVALLGGTAAVLAAFVVGALVTVAAAGLWIFVAPRFGLMPGSGRWLPFGAGLALGFVLAIAGGQVGEVQWPQ
ncbi:MAG TPA: prepilin peptidase [Rhodocyclaceae bacterium]|nr:prepilin peptidase [Rhodocyclaceae bacterium]